MKDNQLLDGNVDLSSNEPHITVDCPICGAQWMKKVEYDKKLFSPCNCKVEYELTRVGMGNQVSVNMFLNKEQMSKLKTR